ncbi:MAG: phosphoglucosamine mutase [Verrucomicrobiota bacterium]
MKRRYFGTDGVRGPFGGPVINPDFAARLGLAVARWVGGGGGKVMIGRDTRVSGPALVDAVVAGLVAGGLAPVSLGVVPTPALARAVRVENAVLGVMITASHNPAADNGIKFFTTGGVKLADEDEAAIEALLSDAVPAGSGVVPGVVAADYVEAMRGLLPPGALSGWRIVLDTAHGATCATSPAVLRALGAEVSGIGAEPDGARINAGVGSEHPGQLAARVLAEGARLGVAHDGDGDRCVLCDELGGVLDGDELLTILATHALEQGRLAANTLVVTQQSNLGVDAAVRAAGGRVVRTPIGDRYVSLRMSEEGALLGGESSGHIICADLSPSGDGLMAALRVIEVMLATGRPLSELRRRLQKFPQGTRNLRVREKRPLDELSALTAQIAALEAEFGETGRVLVRFSGTEPKLRLLVEGASEATVASGLQRLEAAARDDLEVI